MTYVVITFIVLLFLNIYCSEISQMVFYGNKQNAMLEKALLTSADLERLDVMTPANVAATVDKIGNLNLTRLIITDESGIIIYDSTPKGEKYALLPQVVSALNGIDTFTWHYRDGIIQAEAAVPIINYETLAGCVYMMEYDSEQGLLIKSLQNNTLQRLIETCGWYAFELLALYGRYRACNCTLLASAIGHNHNLLQLIYIEFKGYIMPDALLFRRDDPLSRLIA